MTLEELNQKYNEASWLIAKRSTSAAGKALLFSGESLENAAREIAAIYGLSDEEIAQLEPQGDVGAMASVQKVAQGLFGSDTDDHAGQALVVAKTAVQTGRTAKMLTTLLKAGPSAAQAVAAGGKVAGKGTPWGWIATASYAAGTTAWFAYNARTFNLNAFELVRERDGIEIAAPPQDVSDQPINDESFSIQIKLPTPTAIRSRASALSDKAGTAVTSVFGKLRGLRS